MMTTLLGPSNPDDMSGGRGADDTAKMTAMATTLLKNSPTVHQIVLTMAVGDHH